MLYLNVLMFYSCFAFDIFVSPPFAGEVSEAPIYLFNSLEKKKKKSDSPRRRVKQNGDIIRKHFMVALQPQSSTVRVTALKH